MSEREDMRMRGASGEGKPLPGALGNEREERPPWDERLGCIALVVLGICVLVMLTMVAAFGLIKWLFI